MQRIPKYTAGMFKKKMPRFGASGIKMPRMPRMPKPSKPRIKKLAEGGEAEIEEVIIGPGAAQQEYADEIARIQKARKERALAAEKSLVKRYLAASKKAAAKKPEPKVEINRETLRREFESYMQEQERKKKQAESQFYQEMKRGIRTARSGGKMESCCRGDGIAKRGKTRGRFV